MAKINRYAGNLEAFASDATVSGRKVFGDVTNSDDITANITPEFLTGWETIAPDEKPPKQWFNSLGFVLSQLHAYLHQMGIPEWHTGQQYHTGSVVQHAGGIYISKTDNNTGNDPSGDAINWQTALNNAPSVGRVIIRADEQNPNVEYPGTTWVEFGQGQVLLGAGTRIDTRGEQRTFSVGDAAGEYQHVQTAGEVGAHSHTKTYQYAAGGALNLGFLYNDPNIYHGGGDVRTAGGNKTMTTDTSAAANPMNNMQPYTTVRYWRRTA